MLPSAFAAQMSEPRASICTFLATPPQARTTRAALPAEVPQIAGGALLIQSRSDSKNAASCLASSEPAARTSM